MPCDLGLFPLVKEKLRERKFSSDKEFLTVLDQTCADLPEKKWQQIFTNWFIRNEDSYPRR